MSELGSEIYDVLIVGFGPTGATLANLLGRDGIRTAVVERDREVYRLPRAVHFDAEVMRIFQSIGLSEAILPHTGMVTGYQFENADRETLMSFEVGGDEVGSQGWRPDYMFHQPSLESEIRGAASRRECVDLLIDCEVVGFDEQSELVEVRVRDRKSGSTESVRARYVVGCDGAASRTRETAGLELEDLEFDEPWLVVDATTERSLAELSFPSCPLQLCDPDRPTTVIPVMGPYLRWEFMLKPGEGQEMKEPEHVRRLVSAWVDPDAIEIIRAAVYQFHAVVGARWNTARVFLAGDAVHQMPPFLGQGMCAGIRDAANLAWKLVLALRGETSPGLLSSYQLERAAHVREVVQVAVGLGNIICTQDPALAAARDAQMLAERERAGAGGPPPMPGLHDGVLQRQEPSQLVGTLGLQARVRDAEASEGLLDDLVGSGFRLLVNGSRQPELGQVARDCMQRIGARVVLISDATGEANAPQGCAVQDLSGDYARWFEKHGAAAVLVRPDHYVFGSVASASEASKLVEDLAAQL